MSSRLSVLALVACLCAAVSAKKTHDAAYSAWEGYSAGMVLPNTVAEVTNVAKGSCQDGCQNACYGTFSVGDTCYALFVSSGSNYTLPSDGSINWKFATRDCDSGTNYIDFTGACRACPANTQTTSDGTGCTSSSPEVKAVEDAPSLPVGTVTKKIRQRHRLARRSRVDREKRTLSDMSIFDEFSS